MILPSRTCVSSSGTSSSSNNPRSSGFVLHEAGDQLVQILPADARGFLALGFREIVIEADIVLVGIVAARAIVETGGRAVVPAFGPEFKRSASTCAMSRLARWP
jgi:hypothetical protein